MNPTYDLEDRQLIRDEEAMFSVQIILRDTGQHKWTDRISRLRDEAIEIAEEIQQYNDQFQVDKEPQKSDTWKYTDE